MPHIKDSDMEELAEQVLGKLQNMSDEEFAGGYWNRQRKYRKWCWYYSTRNDIIFSVRLEQVGIVCGCPFWKRKGGRYEYVRSAYVGAGDLCSFDIHRQ